MAYNYDPDFLLKHQLLVKQLVQIAQSGEVIQFELTFHRDLLNQQAIVNNVLANMARNISQYADIRTSIRCWSEFKNGKYYLYTGKPQHKIQGGIDRNPRDWIRAYVGAQYAAGEYVHDAILDSPESAARFVGVVTALPASTLQATVSVEGMNENSLDYFRDVFEPYGWSAELAPDGKLLVKRVR